MAPSRFRTRLAKEFHSTLKEPSEFFTIRPINDNFYHFTATIHGLEGSLYEGGHFLLDIKVADSYPLPDPSGRVNNSEYPFGIPDRAAGRRYDRDNMKITFLTPIFHPGIDSDGTICPSTITNGMPSMGLDKKLITLVSVLYDPQGLLWKEGNAKTVAMFVSDRERFNQKAREYTRIHATQAKHAELYAKQYAENSMDSS